MTTAEKRVMTAFRILPEELERINKQAALYRLSRTEYMIRAALGELPDSLNVQAKFEAIEERLDRLERARDLGGFG